MIGLAILVHSLPIRPRLQHHWFQME